MPLRRLAPRLATPDRWVYRRQKTVGPVHTQALTYAGDAPVSALYGDELYALKVRGAANGPYFAGEGSIAAAGGIPKDYSYGVQPGRDGTDTWYSMAPGAVEQRVHLGAHPGDVDRAAAELLLNKSLGQMSLDKIRAANRVAQTEDLADLGDIDLSQWGM